MSKCSTFDYGKRTGQIRTMRNHCEHEGCCNGLNCKYIPEGIETIIAADPQDAIQDAALIEISGQATLAAISAIAPK